MTIGWFVKQGDKTFGPFDAAQIRKYAEAKKIGPKTPVSQSATGPWTSAENIKGLFSANGLSVAVHASAADAVPKRAAALPQPANNAATKSRSTKTGASDSSGSMVFGASALCVACVAAILCLIPSLRLFGLGVSVMGLVLGGLGLLVNTSTSGMPLKSAIGGTVMSILTAVLGGVLSLTANQGTARVIPQGVTAPTEVAVDSEKRVPDNTSESPEAVETASDGKSDQEEKPQEKLAAGSESTAGASHEPKNAESKPRVATKVPSSDVDPYGWQSADFGMTIDEVRTALGDRVSDVNPPQDWGDRYSPIAVQNIELGGEQYVVHLQFGKASQRLEQVLIREKGGADEGKYLSIVKLMAKKYGPPAETTDSNSENAAIWAFPRMEIKASLQRLPGFNIIAITYGPATGKATTNIQDNL